MKSPTVARGEEQTAPKDPWAVLSDKLSSRTGRFVLWVVLFQLLLWVYSPSFSGPFVYDGVTSIANNAELREPGRWWQMLNKHSNSLLFDRRPVPGLLTLINFQVSGLKVFSYRLVNLIIHWLSAVLIGETILLLGKRLWDNQRDVRVFAGSVGVIWALHPLNATPVVYIYQRMESLAVLFYVLCLYGVLRGAQASGTSRAKWHVLLFISGAFSMLSKEIGVTLLVVAPLVDRICHYDTWKRFFQERSRFYGAFALLTSLIVVYLLTGARVADVTADSPLNSPVEYAKVQFRILLRYLKLVFWPDPLIFVATPRHVVSPGQWLPQALLLALILGAVAAAARVPKYRWIWIALIVGACVLAPTSSILPIPTEPEADFRMYLPSACVISVALAGLIWISRELKASRGFVLAVILVMGIGLGMHTRNRAAVFSSDLSIWEDVVTKEPDNLNAWANLGYAFARRGHVDEAKGCAARVLEGGKTIGNRAVLASGHHLQGVALARAKEFDKALEQFLEAVRIFPAGANFRLDLARTLKELGRQEDARKVLVEELTMNPNSLGAGTLLEEMRRESSAE